LFAGKYKSLEEFEKGHKESERLRTQDSMKRAALEKLLGRDDLKKLAASDPEIKDALTKAGYTLAEQAQAEAKVQGDEWDGNEDDPRYQVQQIRHELRLRDQRSEVESTLGRRFAADEWKEIVKTMKDISPHMPVAQAWKLTGAYEKAVKEQHEKEMAKLRGPAKGNPNRPPPALLPNSQKGGDVQKRPGLMSGADKRNMILDIVGGKQ